MIKTHGTMKLTEVTRERRSNMQAYIQGYITTIQWVSLHVELFCLASYMFEKECILLSDTSKNTEQYTYDDHSIDDQGWTFDSRVATCSYKSIHTFSYAVYIAIIYVKNEDVSILLLLHHIRNL